METNAAIGPNPGPSLHSHIPMDSRVVGKPDSGLPEFSGEVVGISSKNIIFIYIILLDAPMIVDGEVHRAIFVPGTLLLEECP